MDRNCSVSYLLYLVINRDLYTEISIDFVGNLFDILKNTFNNAINRGE